MTSSRNRTLASPIIVTGSSGYLGRKLTSRLKSLSMIGKPWKIFEIDRVANPGGPTSDSEILVDLATDSAEQKILDMGEDLNDACIVHLAGLFVKDIASSRTNEEYEHDNLVATERLVSALLKSTYRPHLFIFASTACVYDGSNVEKPDVGDDRAIADYARTKREAEDVAARLEKKGIGVITLRFSRVVGLGQDGLIPQDIISDSLVEIGRAAAFGHTPLFKQGSEHRPYIHVDDVVEILTELVSVKKSLTGRFNVTGQKLLAIGEIPRIACSVLVKTKTLDIVPEPYVFGGTGLVKGLNPCPNPLFSPRLSSSSEVVEKAVRSYCETIKAVMTEQSAPELLRALSVKRVRQNLPFKNQPDGVTSSDWVKLNETLDVLRTAGKIHM